MRTVLQTTLSKLARDSRGAAAIEYGLIAALIAVASIQAMSAVGSSLGDTFSTVEAAMGENAPLGSLPTESPPAGSNGPEEAPSFGG